MWLLLRNQKLLRNAKLRDALMKKGRPVKPEAPCRFQKLDSCVSVV
jgi:hypothetical protein